MFNLVELRGAGSWRAMRLREQQEEEPINWEAVEALAALVNHDGAPNILGCGMISLDGERIAAGIYPTQQSRAVLWAGGAPSHYFVGDDVPSPGVDHGDTTGARAVYSAFWDRLGKASVRLGVRNCPSYFYNGDVSMRRTQLEVIIALAVLDKLEAESGQEYCRTCSILGLGSGLLDACLCEHCGGCGRSVAPDSATECCSQCESCCQCWDCPSCGRTHSRENHEPCSHCESCSRCCECAHCDNCGTATDRDSICGECDCCTSDCCSCSDHNRLDRVKNKMHKFTAPTKNTTNTLTRLLGAEIEVASGDESPRFASAVRKWMASVVEDGSLPDDGSEVVTSPAGGDNWPLMIKDLVNPLVKDSGATVNNKCGLHIHVDAGDLTVWDLKRFTRLYAAMEQQIFDLTTVDTRRCNHYAKPCGDTFLSLFDACSGKDAKKKVAMKHYNMVPRTPSLRPQWSEGANRDVVMATTEAARKAEDLDLKAVAGHKYHDTRYRAVNLHSYWFRGTIEFRHHHGTVSEADIVHWGIVVGSIVDFAANKTDAIVEKLLVQGRARRKCLELVVKQPATVAWMKAKWAEIDSGKRPAVSLADINSSGW